MPSFVESPDYSLVRYGTGSIRPWTTMLSPSPLTQQRTVRVSNERRATASCNSFCCTSQLVSLPIPPFGWAGGVPVSRARGSGGLRIPRYGTTVYGICAMLDDYCTVLCCVCVRTVHDAAWTAGAGRNCRNEIGWSVAFAWVVGARLDGATKETMHGVWPPPPGAGSAARNLLCLLAGAVIYQPLVSINPAVCMYVCTSTVQLLGFL